MKIYNYHPQTLEFICESDARESPLEPGNYLIPANATTVATTAADPGFARKFDPQTDTWATVEDHRGEVVYRTSDAQKIVVDWLGDIGSDYTELAPDSPKHTWDGSQWVPPIPTVQDIKNEAQRRILKFCPDWKQRNLLGLQGRLLQKPSLTPTEQDQMNLCNDVFDHIDAIRQASDALEQTLPSDYTDDQHWPADPQIDLSDK